jgi:hypothetical protein
MQHYFSCAAIMLISTYMSNAGHALMQLDRQLTPTRGGAGPNAPGN